MMSWRPPWLPVFFGVRSGTLYAFMWPQARVISYDGMATKVASVKLAAVALRAAHSSGEIWLLWSVTARNAAPPALAAAKASAGSPAPSEISEWLCRSPKNGV